jgi:hypothetical protein
LLSIAFWVRQVIAEKELRSWQKEQLSQWHSTSEHFLFASAHPQYYESRLSLYLRLSISQQILLARSHVDFELV